ncbi:MAG TPA: class IV adenylate cyclase [Acidobacteriota bacterium]|nr:class IV adenylate cyclase [Acidobacteriota bacterium]
MARNVEIKALLNDFAVQRELACNLADTSPTKQVQEDVFFHVPRGRLKLRQLSDGSGQLIFYDRPDQPGPKTSDYMIYPTDDPSCLKTLLEAALGIRSVVRKTREVFMIGRTRIHLDQVEGLGEFLELEAVLENGEDPEVGREEVQNLMALLKVPPENLVASAYVDLQTQGAKPQ